MSTESNTEIQPAPTDDVTARRSALRFGLGSLISFLAGCFFMVRPAQAQTRTSLASLQADVNGLQTQLVTLRQRVDMVESPEWFAGQSEFTIDTIETSGLSLEAPLTVRAAGVPIVTHSPFANGMNMFVHADAGFRAPYLNFYKSRGTEANPTAVTRTGYELDSIGGINWFGFNGTEYAVACGIYSQVNENWAAGKHGAFLSIYGTSLGSDDPNQLIQFGGLDGTDIGTGIGTTQNIVSYRPITFGGNQVNNAGIFPTSSGDATPPKISLLRANQTGFATLECGALRSHPGNRVTPATNGEITLEATSDTQITVKLKGSDGTVRSAILTLS